MSRPRQFDETTALEGAMVAFWENGYAGTNLPDLLDAMSLTRGSFYKAFHDKHAVYLRAIDHYAETRMNASLAALTDPAEESAHDRLVKMFLRTENHQNKPSPKVGCFVCNAMVEMAPFDPDCAASCARVSERLRLALRSVLKELRPDAPADELDRKSAALERLYFGSHAMGRMGGSFQHWSELLSDLI
ncbi:TetR/AcrR family transcriptional regulator [Ruegeria atlantica]|uniref:TetR/AcrR family transcriptional regulator n=1 Tax=Ruegeria atlantica TaxID=81569 RepID=UPI00147C19CE|nr:TetR/AcrR family transcriptional regulator [Ruegeria atlantica]